MTACLQQAPPRAAVGAEEFRAAMRRFASSVTIITTSSEGRHHGMTATAVCSVSAEPPTILVVVNRTTRSHPLIGKAGAFTVNLLTRDQQALAARFSAKHPDQFDGVDFYETEQTRSPVFLGVASFLECRLERTLDVGTHTVFFGRVLDCGGADAAPLLYHDGSFHGLSA